MRQGVRQGCSFANKQEPSPREDDRPNLLGDTRAGEIELQIPKIRQGSYFPASLSRAGAPSRRCSRTLRDVTRSRPTAVGPAIRSQLASDKMRLVW